jgi:hypothetical protein
MMQEEQKFTTLKIKAMKYHIQYNIGKAKYCLSFHDGVKTHRDGSEFWDLKIFSNKKKMGKEIKEMEKQGYRYGN